MKALPATDPRSWIFQANIHGTPDPSASNPLFNQCEHGTLQFLTWHRAYLHFFERILRSACGDPNFNLPYWDWSTSPTLPEPYRLPANPSNPLYVAGRLLNTGAGLTAAIVGPDLAAAMQVVPFGGTFGFSRRLERSPHGAAHVQIGGLMADPATAGQDPIFWLHHANIDRLWDVWLNQGGGRTNPSDSAFLSQTYSFANETGNTVTVRVGDIIDSARLGYRYDGVPNPAAVTAAAVPQARAVAAVPPSRVAAASATAAQEAVPLAKVEPKKLGFQIERVKLNPVKEARTALTQPIPVQGTTTAAVATPRYVVAVEGISADRPPTATFEVYLNLPEQDVSAATRAKHYLGSIDFFGKTRTSKRKSAQAHGHGHGQQEDGGFTEAFDATAVISRLQQERRWDPDNLAVTLIPMVPLPPGATEHQVQARTAQTLEQANVSYRRVSLRTVTATEE